MQRISGWWLIVAALVLTACGDNSKYLPKPRVSSDDDEAPAPVAAAPAPAAAPRTVPPTGAAVPAAAPARTAPVAATPVATPVATPAATPAAVPATASAPAVPPPVEQKSSELTRRERVIGQLRKISHALENFREKNGAYPPTSMVSSNLSWRVRLLPLLGYLDLYRQFQLNEPWDSPRNRPLLEQIPDEFRSPERNDTSTCYQLVTGPGTAFADPDGLNPEQCTDGIDHTILLVEVHSDLARPWTAAEDYEWQPESMQHDWFGQRQDCCFVALGGAAGVRRLAADIPDAQLRGLITSQGGEAVRFQEATTYAHPDIDLALRQKLAREPVTRQLATAAEPASPASGTAGNVAAARPAAGNAPSAPPVAQPASSSSTNRSSEPSAPGTGAASADTRRLVPGDDVLDMASGLVRDLYGDEFKRAKSNQEKRDFARKLLDDVEKVEADDAGRFVLLRAARDVAAKAGDIRTALDACDRLGREFRVDLLSMKLKVLEQVVTNLQNESELDPLYDTSLQLGDEALRLDDFASAKSAYRLAMNAARRGRKPDREHQVGRRADREQSVGGTADREQEVNHREEKLRESKLAYTRVTDQVHTLVRSPDDPAANAAVGRYYTLIKQDWDRGLPMLARGNDARLQPLAAADLACPTDGEARVAVADQWWELAEKSTTATEQESARARARHWYELAQPQLAASLQKIRVEKRLADAHRSSRKGAKP